MNNRYTILFAYRDRDHLRIRNCMLSLQNQSHRSFEVIFVDYGSKDENSSTVKKLLSEFSFVKYHYVAHPGLLWNKSKAFNYGIRKSNTDYIITADIDLIFHPEFIENVEKIRSKDTFTVFSYAYLPKSLSIEEISRKDFFDLEPSHVGNITGSALYPRGALESIRGFDEFYHFYGSEDEDLFIRLENYGLKRVSEPKNLLAHQWHPRYPTEEKNKISEIPKIHNIRRINMVQYETARDSGRIIPFDQEFWGKCFKKKDQEKLSFPDYSFQLDCREAQVDHFLNAGLPNLKGVVHVFFGQSQKKKSLKSLVKKIAGKNPEPVISLKKVNDYILKTIIYKYRHHNYEFKVNTIKKNISFKINLSDEKSS